MNNKEQKRIKKMMVTRITIIMFISYVATSLILLFIFSLCRHFEIKIKFWGGWGILVFTAAVCSCVSTLITNLVFQSSSKAIGEFKIATKDMASGDFSKRIEIHNKNPFFLSISEDLNKLLDELNSIKILRQDFVSNFSHEFKTPIVSIKGYSELLDENPNMSEEDRIKYIRIIRNECTRLSKLSEDTLLLTKLDSEKIILNKQTVNISKQIEETVLLLYETMKEKSIVPTVELEKIEIQGSASMLKEVWINILTNQIKYNKENGTIYIHQYNDGENIHIVFQDTGIGMKPEEVSHIFDEYYQVDSSRHNAGIGLGMSICKKIINLHGGTITVTSQINIGSVFDISLKKEA